jgi:N,N-dimethylformamidase beta subunit-like, C-terminal
MEQPIQPVTNTPSFGASPLWRTLTVLLLGGAYLAFSSAVQANLIENENLQPGTTEWQLTDPADNRQIEGYASLTSVPIGGDIDLFVNTKDASYTLTVFRMGWYGGKGGRKVLGPQTLAGVQQVTPDPTAGLVECHWTNPFHIHVPTPWVSGIYLAKLHGNTSGKESYITFTVRDTRNADIVFQQSVMTYQAYTGWPGLAFLGGSDAYSLYNVDAHGAPVPQVSMIADHESPIETT